MQFVLSLNIPLFFLPSLLPRSAFPSPGEAFYSLSPYIVGFVLLVPYLAASIASARSFNALLSRSPLPTFTGEVAAPARLSSGIALNLLSVCSLPAPTKPVI